MRSAFKISADISTKFTTPDGDMVFEEIRYKRRAMYNVMRLVLSPNAINAIENGMLDNVTGYKRVEKLRKLGAVPTDVIDETDKLLPARQSFIGHKTNDDGSITRGVTPQETVHMAYGRVVSEEYLQEKLVQQEDPSQHILTLAG